MELKNILVFGFGICCLLISAVACEKEGTGEKAGKEIDRAFDSVKKKLDETTK